ncbi:MAG: Hint domain-containing protein [Polyangiaceae bacterium]
MLTLCVASCSAKNEPSSKLSPSSSSAPTSPPPTTASVVLPKLSPLPALVKLEARNKHEKSGVVTATRLFVPHLTTADTATIMLHWEGLNDLASSADNPLTKRTLLPSELSGAIEVSLIPPAGDPKKPTALENTCRPSKYETPTTLTTLSSVVIDLGAKSFTDQSDPSITPPTAPFSTAGKYTVVLAGSLLPKGDDKLAYRSAPITFDVVAPSPSDRPLVEIGDIAAKEIQTKFSMKDAPKRWRHIIEDQAGNRVVRFYIDDPRPGGQKRGYEMLFVEVIVSRAGEILGIDTREIFSCIAIGTPIATPRGPQPIESLHEGDEVWAFDPSTRTRVVTTVRASVRSTAADVIEIAPGLRVTESHPILRADGSFVTAGKLTENDDIVLSDGRLSRARHDALDTPSDVIELSVDAPHTYIAAGVVVHNKAVATPESMKAARDHWDSLDFRASSPPLKP